jgi:hypothetical protein
VTDFSHGPDKERDALNGALTRTCPSCGREGHFHRDKVDGLLARGLISFDTLAQDSGTPCDCPECIAADRASARYVGTSTSPHDFEPLKPTVSERIFGYVPRCRECMAPEEAHPMRGWAKARPWGDRSDPLVRAWLDV